MFHFSFNCIASKCMKTKLELNQQMENLLSLNNETTSVFLSFSFCHLVSELTLEKLGI